MSKSHHPRGRNVAPKKTNPMQTFYWIIGIVAVVGVAVLATTLSKPAKTTPPGPTAPPLAGTTAAPPANATPTPPLAGTPVAAGGSGVQVGTTTAGFYFKGNPAAPLTIVEYSDFECPACAQFAGSPFSSRLHEEYIDTGKVLLVFHDFPLSYHEAAPAAAHAARCAGEQGYFWEMHDTLFAQRGIWINTPSTASFADLAAQVGADRDVFVECQESGRYQAPIAAAYQAGAQANIPGTPTLMLNGQQLDFNTMFDTLDALLAEAAPPADEPATPESE